VQPAGLTMTVQAGFDGHYTLGDWFPVRVELSNSGQAMHADLQVNAGGDGDAATTMSQAVDLPTPSRKSVTLYSYNMNYEHQLEVRLVRDGTVLWYVTARCWPGRRSRSIPSPTAFCSAR
jgi:hypothetical protein